MSTGNSTPRCQQCGKPAFYCVGPEKVPLCLGCHNILVTTAAIQTEQAERMLNYYSDQMDYTLGLPPSGPRFPPRKPVVNVGGMNLNNFNINQSTIGVLNTGSIQTLDSSITSINEHGNLDLANALKDLAQAVIGSEDLRDEDKNEAIDILSVLSSEATSAPETRKTALAKTLINRFAEIAKVAGSLTTVWNTWGSAIKHFFHIA